MMEVEAAVEGEDEEKGAVPTATAPARTPDCNERGVEAGGVRAMNDVPAWRQGQPVLDAPVLLPTAVGDPADVGHLVSGVPESVDCLLNARARGPGEGSRLTTQRSSASMPRRRDGGV